EGNDLIPLNHPFSEAGMLVIFGQKSEVALFCFFVDLKGSGAIPADTGNLVFYQDIQPMSLWYGELKASKAS
ncbi:MAG: hypothetical protein AB1801_28005, partial [Chloroflexota bacterium]